MINDKGLLINVESGTGSADRMCESLKQAARKMLDKKNWHGLNPHKVLRLCMAFEQLRETELTETPGIDGEQATAPVHSQGDLSGAERASPVPERFRARVITTLTWLIADARYRFDECKNNLEDGSSGGYSPELTEAVELLDELKKGAIWADKDEQIEERLKAGVLSLSEAKEKHKEEIKELDEIIKGGRVHNEDTLEAAYRQGFEEAKKIILEEIRKLVK